MIVHSIVAEGSNWNVIYHYNHVSIFGGKDPIIVKLVVMPMSNHCDSYHVLICSNLSGETISEQKVLEKMDPSLLILDA